MSEQLRQWMNDHLIVVHVGEAKEPRLLAEILADAEARGTARGEAAATHDEAPAWLSGEWAGESIRELLGDLIDEALALDTGGEGTAEEICEVYEEAADAAFASK